MPVLLASLGLNPSSLIRCDLKKFHYLFQSLVPHTKIGESWPVGFLQVSNSMRTQHMAPCLAHGDSTWKTCVGQDGAMGR